jgi:hypothetical protein
VPLQIIIVFLRLIKAATDWQYLRESVLFYRQTYQAVSGRAVPHLPYQLEQVATHTVADSAYSTT